MNRFQASAIHLAGSALIGGGIFLWLHQVWYPGALFVLTGGAALLKILLSVDIALGPLITLVVFNPSKKSLKWDLACVCVLQLAALSYGVYSMWGARPVWLAYNNEHFEIVSVPKIVGRPESAHWEILRKLPTMGPKLIGVLPEKSLRGQLEVEVGLATGASLAYYATAWQPYSLVKKMAIFYGKPLSTLNVSASKKIVLHGFELLYRKHPPVWLPLLGGQQEAAILLNSETGECLGILSLVSGKGY
jgi:hypothetical protein